MSGWLEQVSPGSIRYHLGFERSVYAGRVACFLPGIGRLAVREGESSSVRNQRMLSVSGVCCCFAPPNAESKTSALDPSPKSVELAGEVTVKGTVHQEEGRAAGRTEEDHFDWIERR